MPSTILVLSNLTNNVIPIGTMIVVETGKARAFDELKDDIKDVIGVSYPSSNNSGRAFNVPDGDMYYTNDPILWNNDLTFQTADNAPITNESYVPFNPFAETNNYTVVLTHGFGAVLSSYSSVPQRWVKIRDNVDYDWYLVR